MAVTAATTAKPATGNQQLQAATSKKQQATGNTTNKWINAVNQLSLAKFIIESKVSSNSVNAAKSLVTNLVGNLRHLIHFGNAINSSARLAKLVGREFSRKRPWKQRELHQQLHHIPVAPQLTFT